jgi:hypothetical protein
MELFNNYFGNNTQYCDITDEADYPDPIARVFCWQFGSGIGSYGCPDLLLQNGMISCNDFDLWNCNLCGNDLPFWIPFTDGDTYDFQFQQLSIGTECDYAFRDEDLISGNETAAVSFQIHLCCDDTVFPLTEEMQANVIEQAYVGTFNSNNVIGSTLITPIQMMRVNLQAIREYLLLADLDPCFYFTFKFPNGNNSCFPNADDGALEFYTEPFKYENCEKFPYIYNIESTYTKTDCFGNYYGENFNEGIGTPFLYSNRIRVPGSFEQQSFTITKEKINTTLKTTASQVCENWILRTTHLPQKFAKFVSNIFAGKDVLIDGVEYQIEGELARNNETGSQFYLEVNATNCNCNKSLSCT